MVNLLSKGLKVSEALWCAARHGSKQASLWEFHRMRQDVVIKEPFYHGTTDLRFPYKLGDRFEVKRDGLYICDLSNAMAYALGINTSCRRSEKGLDPKATPLVVQVEVIGQSDINPYTGVSDKQLRFSPTGSGWRFVLEGTSLKVKGIFEVRGKELVPYRP